MTVDGVLNHLTKLFNTLCLSYNRVPNACGHESTIYFVFTYFKDDFLHGKGFWVLWESLAQTATDCFFFQIF
jgi:hypothetical protein